MENYRGRRRKVRRFWTAAAILWTVFIWSNSMQTAAVSSSHSWWVVELLRPVLERTAIPEEWWELMIRKAAHMTEFAVLAAVWCAALLIKSRDERRAALMALLVSISTAACDETIQLFVPGRAGRVTDVLIDTGGAVLVILIYLCAVLLWRRKRR